MVRKLVIAALPAALAAGHVGTASAVVGSNGGGENGVGIDGLDINGIHLDCGGTNGRDTGGGAVVISIELPAPAAI